MTTNHRINVILNHLNEPVQRNVAAKKYVYTVDNKVLSNSQRDFYEENGYLVIRKLIDDALLDECYAHFLDICNRKVNPSAITLVRAKTHLNTDAKGENLYYKIQDIQWDEIFEKYIMHPVLLDYVESFTGPNIENVASMIINKPSGTGSNASQHPTHQDMYYFPFRPIDRVVAVWTAVELVNIENGCLYIVPGTHKAELQPHGYPEEDVNIAFYALRGFEKVPKIPLIMEKGDTVFFHPKLFHGSFPNYSQGFRKALTCHYASSDCHYIDVTGTIQDEVAKELVKIAKIKHGLDMRFTDTWRLRQRHVRGRLGTLK